MKRKTSLSCVEFFILLFIKTKDTTHIKNYFLENKFEARIFWCVCVCIYTHIYTHTHYHGVQNSKIVNNKSVHDLINTTRVYMIQSIQQEST